MDVDRLQKINSLALSLLQQGLATDREDAVQQAEKIYQKNSQEYTELRTRVAVPTTNQQPQGAISALSAISQDQLKDILEKNTTFMVKKIQEFQSKIESLQSDIGKLQEQMVSRPANIVREVPMQAQQEQQQQQPKQQQASPSSSHPRVGAFNSQDVSIEKFFYMGNKK